MGYTPVGEITRGYTPQEVDLLRGIVAAFYGGHRNADLILYRALEYHGMYRPSLGHCLWSLADDGHFRSADIALVSNILFDVPFDEVPLYLYGDDRKVSVKLIAKWRLMIGK